jgi:hypothetical protein
MRERRVPATDQLYGYSVFSRFRSADIGRIKIPQCSGLLTYWGVLRSEARKVLIADQAISLLRDLQQRKGADAAIDAAKVRPRDAAPLHLNHRETPRELPEAVVLE